MRYSEIEELQDNFVRCRTIGHAWDEIPAKRKAMFTFQEAYRCVRCGTQRFDSVGVQGDIVQREYKYPEGYALSGRVNRAVFRVEMRKRRLRRKRAAQ